MKRNAFIIIIVGGLATYAMVAVASAGGGMAQSASKSALSPYRGSKGNRLALAAARALAEQDCTGKISVTARKPNKSGGWVSFICGHAEFAVIIHFTRPPASSRLIPDRFSYAG